MKNRSIGLLTAGHIVTDINQGALPAMLPFLISAHNLSFASAAFLVFAANVSSSIVQPLFGYFADKISAPWITPAGVLLAGLGLAAAGLAPNYLFIFIAVAISGIGIAAFHPEGARLVNNVSGEKKGTGMSMFTAGGNVGFAAGPIITTVILLTFGLKGTLFLIIPVTVMSVLLIVYLPKEPVHKPLSKEKKVSVSNSYSDEWRPFSKLLGAITCRSIVFYGLNTFLPLYWINVFKQSKSAGSYALTLLLIMGAIGTLIAGRMADRIGHKNMVRIGFSALIPLMLIFTHVNNIYLATFMLVPIGFALFSPFSPMVVLGQKYLPNHMGLASGVTLGLAVSIGGAFAPLLGSIADHSGIHAALNLISILPIAAAAISFFLPTPKVDRINKERKKENDILSGVAV